MRLLMMLFLVPLSLAALAAPATAATPRAAATSRTVELPVTVDWRIGYTNPSTCASWALATWAEQEGATRWELLYKWNGRQGSKTLSPPFDDDTFDRFGWRPAAGTHWFGLSYSGRSAVNRPVGCGDLQARQRAAYSDVRIKITVAADATIEGVVKAPNGDPLRGVRVSAGRGLGARTDAGGQYEIDVPEAARTYVVRASKGRLAFRPRRRRVAVRPGTTARASFRARGYVIMGRVTERCPDARASRTPAGRRCARGVEGARVTAKTRGAKPYRVRTDGDGRFVMLVRERGGYVVKFSVDGRTWTKRKAVRRPRVVVNQDIGNRNTGAPITR